MLEQQLMLPENNGFEEDQQIEATEDQDGIFENERNH